MAWLAAAGCVPTGNVGAQDAGASPPLVVRPTPPPPSPPSDVLRTPFEDNFDRTAPVVAPTEAGGSPWVEPGPDWVATGAGIWRIEGGQLCGERAHNRGIWLNRVLPVNARIEFDATSGSADGDLKAEYWGDGRSYATALSYTNATSYLAIFGGWHNKFHVLARINEHGNDRQEITVDPNSDDPREKPAVAGQSYHFRVERSDGKTIKWWVNGNEMFSWTDTVPLAGVGHDHFGFNDWDVKLCFDNFKVVPLP